MTHEYFTNLRIVEVRLENFRSFRRARLSLEDLTFIVGRNAAGKSNLLDAVEFLRECVVDGAATALRRRGGLSGVRWHGSAEADPVGVSVVMRGPRMADSDEEAMVEEALYGFRLRPGPAPQLEEVFRVPGAPDLSFHRRGASSLALADARGRISPAMEALYMLESARCYQLSTEAISAPADTRAESVLLRTGENAADIASGLMTGSHNDTWGALLRALGRVSDGIVDVKARNFGPKVYLNFVRQNGVRHEFGAEHASAGTLRALGILLAFAQRPTPSLVAIDEIEDSFHPGAFNVLIGEAEAASRSFPVVLTTHSPDVLSHPSARATRIRVIEWRDGSSQIFRLNERTTAAVGPLESVGDLLRENALGLAQAAETFSGDLLSL